MQTIYTRIPAIESFPTRRRETFPEIEDEVFWSHYEVAKQFSLIHVTGFYNVYQSLRYVAANEVPGDLVECGCFLGGMTVFILRVCEALGLERRLHVFDSFVGHPDDEQDVMRGSVTTGPQFESVLHGVWGNLRANVGSLDRVELIQGFVEDTIPEHPIERIALLRLDTDFYSSTRVELEHYYPALSEGGVLIIDDYGFFHGARRATDEYLSALDDVPLLHRVDSGIWTGVKPGSLRGSRALRAVLGELEGSLVVRLRNAVAGSRVIGPLAGAGARVARRILR